MTLQSEKAEQSGKTLAQSGGQNEQPTGKCADWKFELLALSGFCVSGVIFIVSGLRSGDALTIAGSAVWLASCLCWMLPYKKYF